jgi:glucose dehydrogenase
MANGRILNSMAVLAVAGSAVLAAVAARRATAADPPATAPTTATAVSQPVPATSPASSVMPAPQPASLLPPEDGQWPMAAKNYANTRYSGLDQITAKNAKDLKVAWTFSTGVNRGQEAAPIVVGQTMYVVTPYPNILYALDVADAGRVKWKYQPKPAAAA